MTKKQGQFIDVITGKPIKGVEVIFPLANGIYRGVTGSDGRVKKCRRIKKLNLEVQYTVFKEVKDGKTEKAE